MNRAEHLAWCKERALACLDTNDNDQAWVSMLSGLSRHPETRGHAGAELGIMLRLGGHLATVPEMRKFIEDFN